ncbi:integrator complex subunit 13-like [Acanthaster planci]|uniref:Integrator complex subunit 13-like n=1 Tax=Acanthaster planci TaxID=133434 RepID=A0A8B7ZPN6_ACAPL|nr:integrator complex subunit 13-like [Acanthaster planci]
MSFPASHKTIFVLDHGPFFAESCEHPVEYDVVALSKTRSAGFIPLAPFCKSLWTCSVESVLEYCRVVYDIFPKGKLICVVASDTQARPLNSWSPEDQNTSQLMSSLAALGPLRSSKNSDASILNGLSSAIEMMMEGTDHQVVAQSLMNEDGGEEKVVNRGRIICLTSVKSESHGDMLTEYVRDAIMQQNKVVATSDSDNLLLVGHCELTLINILPTNKESGLKDRSATTMSPHLSAEIHSAKAGRHLANKLSVLAQKHYDLAITTVTGIPMKEEQNAMSSANYDVELLHLKDAHSELRKLEAIMTNQPEPEPSNTMVISTKGPVATVTKSPESNNILLKWCQPRSNSVELLHCMGAYRISPVGVNSRPSVCLTNFLLNGRQVMLEQPRKSGTKVISHMLASHGGEIFLHCLATARSPLEDPPSISEGCGGRVTDYRINDFGEFMKENRLAPCQPTPETEEEPPVDRAKAQLERMTRHWPMVISDTIIFNMPSHLDPLPTLITKLVLTDDDVLECKKAMYHVVGMETRNEPLPVPMVGSRGKGPKRDEHYRQMWAELEVLVRAHSSTSPAHEKILQCLLDCRKPPGEEAGKAATKRAADKVKVERSDAEAMEIQPAWPESDRSGADIKPDIHKENVRGVSDQPPLKKQKMFTGEVIGKPKAGPQSLLSLWNNRINSIHSKRHAEFAGRQEATGKVAELYPNLMREEKESTNGEVKKERTT